MPRTQRYSRVRDYGLKRLQNYLDFYFPKNTVEEIVEGLGAENIKEISDTKEVFTEVMSSLIYGVMKMHTKEPNINREPQRPKPLSGSEGMEMPTSMIKKHINKKYL